MRCFLDQQSGLSDVIKIIPLGFTVYKFPSVSTSSSHTGHGKLAVRAEDTVVTTSIMKLLTYRTVKDFT